MVTTNWNLCIQRKILWSAQKQILSKAISCCNGDRKAHTAFSCFGLLKGEGEIKNHDGPNRIKRWGCEEVHVSLIIKERILNTPTHFLFGPKPFQINLISNKATIPWAVPHGKRCDNCIFKLCPSSFLPQKRTWNGFFFSFPGLLVIRAGPRLHIRVNLT